MNNHINEPDADLTIPPVQMLRSDTPAQLYLDIPELQSFTRNRPSPEEDPLRYLERLRSSTTPEDAVTFSAFAAQPRAAIDWGVQSVRMTLPDLSPDDRQLLAFVMQWMEHPGNENRWRTLQVAMFAARRSPVVYLGLAVGWSGGPLAPNDPSMPPKWRAPYAINRAVLTSIAVAGADGRSVNLARVLDLASGLFRIY
jgi:hypothetical protein